MKILFAICLIKLFVGQSYMWPQSDFENERKALYSTCNAKFPITDEMIRNTKNGIYPVDRNFKCFLMCLLDERSIINEEAVINGELLVNKSPDHMKEIVENVVNTCLTNILGKPDKCEVVFNFVTCALKTNSNTIKLLPS